MSSTLDRRNAAMKRLKAHASKRGISLTKLVKRYLSGWPRHSGPNLTAARAEAIADKLDTLSPTNNQQPLGKDE